MTSATLCRARIRIRSLLLLAIGCPMTTTGWPVIPSTRARISAALVKASVITVTAGLPRFSASIPSWRPHAVQDPQSATA